MTDQWQSGAIRDTQTGRGRYDLLPPRAIHRVAQRFELGARHYGDRNWERGMPVSRCICSALRHLFALLRGDKAEDHAAAAAWNVLAAMELADRAAEGLIDAQYADLPAAAAGDQSEPTHHPGGDAGATPATGTT